MSPGRRGALGPALIVFGLVTAAIGLVPACGAPGGPGPDAGRDSPETGAPPEASPEVSPEDPPKVPPKPDVPDRAPKTLYEAYCGACHDLKLVQSQRLDKATWEWVMEDMVGKYGATWITPEEQRIIRDYLTENFGRRRR